jgi:protein O-GlcNAc transferase
LCADEFVTFLPHLEPPLYKAVNRLSDVFLDSIGWSGCNSTLAAISCNLPLVTLPGRLMRGRHSFAILKMMGLEAMIAKDLDDYISIAVRYAADVGWRKEMSESIRERKHCLYGDTACIGGLESFLERAVGEHC